MKSKAIKTQDAPEAIGPYSQAIVVGWPASSAGKIVFCSGQIGLDPATGKLQLTPSGDIIPGIVLQPANYTVLGKMAALSRAKFYRATNRRELQHIYNEIDRLEKTEIKLRRFTTYRPLFQWPLLAAFGLLALELLLSNTRLRRVP